MLRYRARRDNDDGKSGSTAAQLSAKERLKNLARTDHIDCSKKITRMCLVKWGKCVNNVINVMQFGKRMPA